MATAIHVYDLLILYNIITWTKQQYLMFLFYLSIHLEQLILYKKKMVALPFF